jgi:hypothetical protein
LHQKKGLRIAASELILIERLPEITQQRENPHAERDKMKAGPHFASAVFGATKCW